MRDFEVFPQYHYQSPPYLTLNTDECARFESAGTDDAGAAENDLLIAYGTESGTAEMLASELGKRFSGLTPAVESLANVPAATLADYSTVLIVCSTFGDGEVPRNAVKFAEALKALPPSQLRGTQFSVCGLGSRIYANFCKAAITLDRLLAKAGASRLVPLHKADELQGQMETFTQWHSLVGRLLGLDGLTKPPPKTLTAVFTDALPQPAPPSLGTAVVAIENTELLRSVTEGSRSTRHVAFDIAESGLVYETGDHLGVYPCNDSSEVARLARAVGVGSEDLGRVFHVEDSAHSGVSVSMPFPTPITVAQALTDELDISLREP